MRARLATPARCPCLPAQDIFNLLPNLNAGELSRSLAVESNDMMAVIYLSALIRSVVALHGLIENKEARALHERERAAKEAGGKGKAKEKKEGEKDGDGKDGNAGKDGSSSGAADGGGGAGVEKENNK